MYRLDSGLLGIILTLLLIGFNFYASYRKKKRQQIKRNGPQVVNSESAGEEAVYREPGEAGGSEDETVGYGIRSDAGVKDFFHEFGNAQDVPEEDDLFDFFFNKKEDNNKEDKLNKEEDRVQDREAAGYDEFSREEAVYDNGLESVENSGPVFRFAAVEGQHECTPVECDPVEQTLSGSSPAGQDGERTGGTARGAGLKRRLKMNPRDLVLFSEILRPRYKDF